MKYLKVKDPKSNYQLIYLNPRQGLCLELSYPLGVGADEDWKVELFSEFMVEEKKEKETGRRFFYFIQPFDMKDWAKVSNVYLAEISIAWVGQKRPYKEFETRHISVVLQAGNRVQRDILTVVNPIYNHVRMYPHQTLEVVIFDEKNSQPDYKVQYINGEHTSSSGNINLAVESINEKLVVQKWKDGRFTNVDEECYALNRTTCELPPNPRLDSKSPYQPLKPLWSGPYKAHHFYFRLDRAALQAVTNLRNGIYQSTEIVFHEDLITSQDFGIEVFVAVKGSKKSLIRRLGETRRQKMLLGGTTPKKDSFIHHEKLIHGERVEGHYLLINPKMNDVIEFIEGEDNSYIVEIAPPHVFSETVPMNLKWEVAVEPAYLFNTRHESHQRITCVELDQRVFDGQVTQRFLVSPLSGHSLKKNQKFAFFGIVTFSCHGRPDLSKRVTCYMLDQTQRRKTPSGPGSAHYGGGTGTKSYYSAPPKPVEKTYFKVRFREVINDLSSTASSVKFLDIKITNTDTNTKKEGKGKKKVEIVHPTSQSFNRGWGYG